MKWVLRMSLFLFITLGLYSAVHIYALIKARNAIGFGTGTGILIGVFMAGMILALLMIKLFERWGCETLARLAAYIGYTWMGMIFFFFSLALILDVVSLAIQIVKMIPGLKSFPGPPSAMSLFLLPLAGTLIISVVGYFGALKIRTERFILAAPQISASLGRVRIVQISDLHLGIIVRRKRLQHIITAIKAAEPDILVSTGDLVDGQINSLKGLAEILAGIKPPFGKFAIMGNHEYYAGFEHSLNFMQSAGFTVLRGEALSIPGMITVAGMDDPAGKHFGLYRAISENILLDGLPRGTFTLLLKHLPIVRPEAVQLFELQLSGHTHKGQIFPFVLMVRAFFPNIAGWYDLGDHAGLYVSRGTGTWGPPMRFLAPPEITVIDLVHGLDKNWMVIKRKDT
jgi:uncharacterized protein